MKQNVAMWRIVWWCETSQNCVVLRFSFICFLVWQQYTSVHYTLLELVCLIAPGPQWASCMFSRERCYKCMWIYFFHPYWINVLILRLPRGCQLVGSTNWGWGQWQGERECSARTRWENVIDIGFIATSSSALLPNGDSAQPAVTFVSQTKNSLVQSSNCCSWYFILWPYYGHTMSVDFGFQC